MTTDIDPWLYFPSRDQVEWDRGEAERHGVSLETWDRSLVTMLFMHDPEAADELVPDYLECAAWYEAGREGLPPCVRRFIDARAEANGS